MIENDRFLDIKLIIWNKKPTIFLFIEEIKKNINGGIFIGSRMYRK